MTAPYKEGDFERAIEADLSEDARGDAQWLAGDPDSYDVKLGLDATELDAFIAATQATVWQKLVSSRFAGDDAKARASFHQTVAKMLDSQGVLRTLREGVTVLGVDFDLAYFRPEHGLTEELSQRYAANRVTITRQVAYSASNNNTLDLTLLLNGIPVATAELKNQLTNQTVEHAKVQYRKDRDPRELIFAKRALVHFAVDTDEVYLATRLRGEHTRFLPFNQGNDEGKGNPPATAGKYKTSYLWEEVWERDNWLDILRRFVHVEKSDDGETTVIFPRYHQWRTVLRTLAHAREHGAGQNYLIQHSAGSGKSNTIAWLAHRLAVLHNNDEPVFDKVIVVTDRLALDQQLGDTVFQFEHKTGLVQKARAGSKQLAEGLKAPAVRIVISTLQKFPFVIEQLEEVPGANYAVIIDEAHSSQGPETRKALQQALRAAGKVDEQENVDEEESDEDKDDDASPTEVQNLVAASVAARGPQDNISYFAFTATPTRRTLELFGKPTADGKTFEPFDLYSMRQAIDEEFILDVLKSYTPYSVLWKVASNATDKEVDKSKATQAIVRYVSRHPKALDEKARIIVEHFHSAVRHKVGGNAKAMVVCASRELAVLTYFAIKKLVEKEGYADCHPLVAFSDSVPIDGDDFTEAGINGFGGTELPKKFGWVPTGDATKDKEHQLYRILVVAEKYQTGFDQPLLHTMYVDKKLRGIRAVQTLSRLNRIHPEKDDTFVLDFVNDGEKIRAAFEDFYKATLTYATDPAELYVAHGNLTAYDVIDTDDEHAFAKAFLGPQEDEQTANALLYNYLEPALTRFKDLGEETQKAFRAVLVKFIDLYGFMAQVIAFTDERLEATFLYGRHLQRVLPSEGGGALDIGGDITLTHLRIEAGAESDVSPATGGEVSDAESGDTTDPVDPSLDNLAHIIDSLNERYGAELGGGDRIILEQVLGGMAEDDELVQEAKVNSKDNFQLVFGAPFEDHVMRTESTNSAFFDRFFSDEQFRSELVKGMGAEFHRRHASGDEAAA